MCGKAAGRERGFSLFRQGSVIGYGYHLPASPGKIHPIDNTCQTIPHRYLLLIPLEIDLGCSLLRCKKSVDKTFKFKIYSVFAFYNMIKSVLTYIPVIF